MTAIENFLAQNKARYTPYMVLVPEQCAECFDKVTEETVHVFSDEGHIEVEVL